VKALIFIHEIFKRFPLLFIINVALITAVGFFGAFSLFSISPIVDLLVHPDLQGISALTQKAIDVLEFFGLPGTLNSWLIIFVMFISLASVFLIFARHSILKTKYALSRQIIVDTFKDFFDAQWHFFSSGKQGVLLNTFTREINVVGDAFGAMALFFASALQLLFFLAIPFYISWQVTLIGLGTAFLCTLPFMLLGRISYKLGISNTATANHFMSVIQENIGLAKIVLGFGNQKKSSDNLSEAFDAHRNVTIKSQVLDVAIGVLYRPVAVVVIAVVLFAARRFNLPLAEITVLLLAIFQIVISVGNLTKYKNSLDCFFPSYEQIMSLRKQAKELKQESGNRQFKGFSRELLLERLSFAYPGHKELVLSDINMRISKGNMVAIVGESGAGKSTFIDMIMVFHQPIAGRISLDGIPVSDFDVLSYRRKIGYVPQDSVLFNMTIRDNLLWACESATDDEIIEAARHANADDFIRQLPKGYNTLVGDRGIRLSGGQRQRITLARAILRKPALLILDEATSSLDTYSERLIQQAIENIAKNTTVIVIAHRLSTIINANYVYVLKKGRIVEEGAYSELVKMKGHFNRMVELQTIETAK